MTIREFSDKYGYSYHIPYKALCENGVIITHTHDVEYEECDIYHAVMEYFRKREYTFKKKAKYYIDQRNDLKSKYVGEQKGGNACSA